MRKDMSKKLCERPRIHDSWGIGDRYERSKGKVRVNDLEIIEDEDGNETLDVNDNDSGRKFQAMSLGRGDKELGENLAPLYRYLESQVNRPWDKVYSDIRENVRFDSATQLHILQHMRFYVKGSDGEGKETLIEENKRIYEHSPYYGNMEIKKGDLFIHPRTGILSRYKKEPKSRFYRPTAADVKRLDTNTFLCRIDKVWFEVVYPNKYFHGNDFSFSGYFRTGVIGHPGNLDWGRQLDHEVRRAPKNILKQEGLKNGSE